MATATGTVSSPTPTGSANLPVGSVWSAVALDGDELDWSPAGRAFSDVIEAGGRLIAVGRDAAKPLIALSDNGGLTWRVVATNEPDATETEELTAVAAGPGGRLVAAGLHAGGCQVVLDIRVACGRFRPIIWRSADNGETWEHLDASEIAAAGPEVHPVDVAGDGDGFVLAANIQGPSPAGARAWASPDGSDWTEVAAFQPSAGWLARASSVFALGDETYVAGTEVVCGDWFDNGFWVISGTFVTRARLWQVGAGDPTPVDLASAGIAEPPLPNGCGDEFVSNKDNFSSAWRNVGLVGSRPSFVDNDGEGVHVLGSDGAWADEPLRAPTELNQVVIAAQGDWLVVQSSADGPVNLTGYAHHLDGSFQSGQPGNTIFESADTFLAAATGNSDFVVAVGSSADGKRPAIWRSVPSPALAAAPSCDPAPGADCRGVSLFSTDLTGQDLAGIDFRGAALFGVNFAGANLTGAQFEGATITDPDFSGANLTGANLIGVSLQEFLDSQALLGGANFTGADLRAAHMDLVDGMALDGASARQARLRVTRPATVSAQGADLREVYLATDFGADTVGVTFDFTSADLRRLGVSGVDLTGSTFSNADVGHGLATGMWFGNETPCPNGRNGELIGFQMYSCPGLTN